MCVHEPVPRLIEETAEYRYGHFSRDQLVAQLRETRPANIDGRRYGESANRLSLAVPALAEAFPDAQFIWLLRDGREVVSSVMQRGWFDPERVADTPWEHHRLRGDRLGEISEEEWAAWSPFRRTSWLWRRTNELIGEDLAELEPDRHITVRLEDLESRLPDIAEFLDVRSIPWAIPRPNARSATPDTGPGTVNEVSQTFTSQNWSDDQSSDFELEAGAFMDTWYPHWKSAVPAEAKPPPADLLSDVQIQLAELRTMRGELSIVNAHTIRLDRQSSASRARNQQLNEKLLQSGEKHAEVLAKLTRTEDRLTAARR